MIFNAFNQETYILALRDYLTKRMYLTARPADLWESFGSFISIPIGNRNASIEEVMNTWTNQPGYPIVHASLNNSIITLTQVILYSFIYILLYLIFLHNRNFFTFKIFSYIFLKFLNFLNQSFLNLQINHITYCVFAGTVFNK